MIFDERDFYLAVERHNRIRQDIEQQNSLQKRRITPVRASFLKNLRVWLATKPKAAPQASGCTDARSLTELPRQLL
jgi:hypothetical protein